MLLEQNKYTICGHFVIIKKIISVLPNYFSLCFCFFQIDLNDDGTVCGARCECARGQHKCHHMGAVLLHGIRTVSSTDKLCTWNRSEAPDSVCLVDELFPAQQFRALLREPTQEDRNYFRAKLKLDGITCGMRWLLAPEPESAQLPASTVDMILGSQDFLSSSNQLGCFLKLIEVNADQILAVENLTKGQRDNSTWGMFRKGRITASNFGPVISNVDSHRGPSQSLIKSLLGEYDLSGLKAIQYGIHHEAEAVKMYEVVTGNRVRETGLWLHPSGLLGASPDGLISDNKVLEVKCPMKAKDMMIEEAILEGNFFLSKDPSGNTVIANNAQGRRYYHQVQGQLALTGRDICHFVVWTQKDLRIVEIERDQQWAANIKKLMDFHIQNIFPVLKEQ